MNMLLYMILLNCNTFNKNRLNQDVVFNLNSDEHLRLQFSDQSVRVTSTKVFISQILGVDNLSPLVLVLIWYLMEVIQKMMLI